MQLYAYKGTMPLGQEPLGTEHRTILRNYKTLRGARKFLDKAFKGCEYSLYAFTNFYDDKTFTKV